MESKITCLKCGRRFYRDTAGAIPWHSCDQPNVNIISGEVVSKDSYDRLKAAFENLLSHEGLNEDWKNRMRTKAGLLPDQQKGGENHES